MGGGSGGRFVPVEWVGVRVRVGGEGPGKDVDSASDFAFLRLVGVGWERVSVLDRGGWPEEEDLAEVGSLIVVSLMGFRLSPPDPSHVLSVLGARPHSLQALWCLAGLSRRLRNVQGVSAIISNSGGKRQAAHRQRKRQTCPLND